ncbi:MAG: VUT family protein [Clostridiales bacterium]|nr:VUT family protein [Candidatus Blautia equi]
MNQRKTNGLYAEAKALLRSIPSLTVTMFIIATITMNLLANKSVNLPVSWLAVDCGIFVSWGVFLALDIVTKRFGPRAATILSVVSLLVNFCVGLLFFLVSKIPGMWGESYVDGAEAIINTALDHTFGGTWYILVGSSIAFFLSAVVNNFSNWYIGKMLKNKRSFGVYACRTYVSTFIAQFVDNLTFALIVSRNFFGWTMVQCIMCAFTGAVLELLCEVVFSPIGYHVSNQWDDDGVGENYLKLYPVS